MNIGTDDELIKALNDLIIKGYITKNSEGGTMFVLLTNKVLEFIKDKIKW